ncbi:MAG: suppressor of fused domain protein [Oscillospiraceae bacterium]|nr:suppressor of fused domain protein [Oscillospiraceae bacterium]
MTKKQLIKLFESWREDGEHEKIINTILALPDSALDDDILDWLVEEYIDTDEYKKAIAVLESQRPRLENDYKWHFRMGLALYRASEDEECEDDDSLRRNILERARVALARGMNMNPPEATLETADKYMERIEEELDELRDDEDDEDEGNGDDIELYEEEELDAIEEHIKEYYGDFPTVFHEISSPDIHCDICIVPPNDERNYYTLLTMGMGAHLMDIPKELPVEENARAELLICLPPDWKVGENSEEWFWPISLLKNLARLPINCETWLGWGHSVDHQQPFADSTELSGSLLIYPENVEDGAEACVLPNGDTVNFFEVIPIYREEMDFKIDNDTKSLLERMSNVSHIVDINRPNTLEGYSPQKRAPIDSARDHSKKIVEKKLPLDLINGCNHIAIFMRWCIEHDLVAPEFHRDCPDVIEGVKSGEKTDIRDFILNFFGGDLEIYQLSFVGAGFAHYYYNWDNNNAPRFYPADVDDYAEHYFGTERYNCEEFADEAYMFVPFDEEYYKGMSRYIERAFQEFFPGFAEYQHKCSVETFEAVSKALGIKGSVPLRFDNIKQDYDNAVKDANGKKHSPLLMIIDGSCSPTVQEDFTEVLEDALNPFLETIVIADIGSGAMDWAGENFDRASPAPLPEDKYISGLSLKMKARFGTVPAVLMFNSEQSSLFMPTEDGRFVRFVGKGIAGAEEDD